MEIDHSDVSTFRSQLLNWHEPGDRPMPWKKHPDIYWVWISEIMLQQTRVDQVIPFFERFVQRFPKVEDLAASSEGEVLKYWEGLGYYSRARNLHKASKVIAYELNGVFPENLNDWLSIPGVGPYTAAAITSFAFNHPNAVVDGNVYRVLSRYFGILSPIDSTKGKKEFATLAQKIISEVPPADWNQAIMDFGATVCKPNQPDCSHCPLNRDCHANLEGSIRELPVKLKKIQKTDWSINYLHVHDGNRFLLRRRSKDGIWGGLHEFPTLESPGKIGNWMQKNVPDSDFCIKKVTQIPHQLTHKNISATFYELKANHLKLNENSDFVLADEKNLTTFAVHSLMKKYFTIFMG
ncbi:MAG: A/G-specific adenine glycosylase [Saprospirales bacterium]|nr:MAG: A/G-specific adenine glycosylase [Saprospirales bacterium]